MDVSCLLEKSTFPVLTMKRSPHLEPSFLAHLSTTCSGGAIVTGHRPTFGRPSVRPSINNFFKNLLLQNQKANIDKTWQECSLGEALQKLLKEFNSNKTLVAMATKWLKMEKIFKNLLVTNHKAGSIHILYEASLGDPLPKLLKLFPWGHIWALPVHTLFYIETKKETFNKSFSDKP